jgi:hypothetical protein
MRPKESAVVIEEVAIRIKSIDSKQPLVTCPTHVAKRNTTHMAATNPNRNM